MTRESLPPDELAHEAKRLDAQLSDEDVRILNARIEAAENAEWSADDKARALVAVLRAMRVEPTESPNVLPEVQNTLHVRSRGRFYRDRFSRADGLSSAAWILALITLALVCLLCAWFYISLSSGETAR